MRIAVFGSGSIGRRHIGNLQRLVPGCEFVLVRRESLQDDFSRSLNAQVTDTAAGALAMSPDIAIVATPSALHFDALAPCIAANLPVYLEKPALTSHEEVEKTRKLLAGPAYTAPSQMGCNLRFLPVLRKAKELMSQGRLGTIGRANLQVGQYLPDWRPAVDHRTSYSADRDLGGGVLFDLIHEIDLALYFFGPCSEVSAMTAHVASLEIRSEAVASLIMRPDAGLPLISAGLDYLSRRPLRRYDIVGDKGTLQIDLIEKKAFLDTSSGRRVVTEAPEDFDVPATYLTAMSELLEAVRTGSGTSQDIHAGLATASLAITAGGAR